MSKDWSAHDVAMAVRMVGKGMTVFAPRAEQPSAPLSEREREVLTHMASGATNKEIAERLYLSPAHRQGAHELALQEARGAQPRRGRAARGAARADRLMPAEPWERTLGAAGLRVTAIGLGLAALGRPGYINLGHGEDLGADRSVAALERHAHAVLDAAYDAGVRYFDAARSYGRAEEFLASWLRERGLAPGDVTVGSKWGYTYTAGWQVDADPPEVKDLSVDTLRRQIGETRALLGEHLALYQIHSATIESGVLEDPAVLDALAELREPRACAIGLTTTGPGQARDDRAGARGRRLRHGPGDLEPARASAGPALG